MRIFSVLTALILALAPFYTVAGNKNRQIVKSFADLRDTPLAQVKCAADLKPRPPAIKTGPNGLPLFNENSKLFSAQPSASVYGQDALLLGQIVKRVKLGTAESPRPTHWKTVFYNVKNLVMRVGRSERGDTRPPKPVVPLHQELKSPEQIDWQRNLLSQAAFNQAVLVEVASGDDLKEFFTDARFKMQYEDFLVEGNDINRIDLGMVAQKGVRFEAVYVSYKNVKWKDPVDGVIDPVFPRDLPVMFLVDIATGEIVLITVGKHGKSQLDRGGDKKSRIWRESEFGASDQIVRQLLAEYGEEVRIIEGGDYNVETRGTESDCMTGMKKIMRSVFDLTPDPTPAGQRITETYHPKNGPTLLSQLDDAFVTKGLFSRILGARVIRYRSSRQSPTGTVLPYAQSFDQRSQQPSDHLPIEVEIDIAP